MIKKTTTMIEDYSELKKIPLRNKFVRIEFEGRDVIEGIVIFKRVQLLTNDPLNHKDRVQLIFESFDHIIFPDEKFKLTRETKNYLDQDKNVPDCKNCNDEGCEQCALNELEEQDGNK